MFKKFFLIILILFANFLFFNNALAFCNDVCRALDSPTNYLVWTCCPGGNPNNECIGPPGQGGGVAYSVGWNHGCAPWPTDWWQGIQTTCVACWDGSQACGTRCIRSVSQVGTVGCDTCDPTYKCIETVVSSGTSCINNDGCCPSGCTSGNDTDCSVATGCAMANLNCPTTCTIGQNFNVSYEFRNVDTKPKTSHRIEGSIASGFKSLFCNPYDYRPNDYWETVSQSVACTSDLTGNIRVGAHVGNVDWMDWCDYTWSDAMINCSISCNVTPVPAIPLAIGYVKVKHPLGILSLRLISFANALSALKGIIKIARFGGDTNAAADLVATSSPDASPVRVKTPYGIKAWRMQR